jgi:hypothetical protein
VIDAFAARAALQRMHVKKPPEGGFVMKKSPEGGFVSSHSPPAG